MDALNWLLTNPPEITQQTWHAQGELTVNKHTKLYTANSIVRVITSDMSKPLSDHFIFITETYSVDNIVHFEIDWDEMSVDDINGKYVAVQGIAVPYFAVLPGRWDASLVYDNDFIPYQNGMLSLDDGGIQIPDIELEAICVEIGLPFLSFSDLEYSKREIKRTCIRMGMQWYFSYRPIIREETAGNYAIGSDFHIPFPPTAFQCVPFYTVPGGYGNSGMGSPFAFYNEQMLFAGGGIGGGLGGGRFGRPIRYNKPVPGYAGLDEMSSLLDALAARQGYLNFFRREKYKRVRLPDGSFECQGFSTIGGILNIRWFCYSNDWNDIPMDEVITLARPMCQYHILNQFGMLRSLVKQDLAGQLDPTVLTNKAEKIKEGIDKLTGGTLSLIHSVMRGGG